MATDITDRDIAARMTGRTEVLRVRLWPVELARIHERSGGLAGAELADWVRRQLLGGEVEPRAPKGPRRSTVHACSVCGRTDLTDGVCPDHPSAMIDSVLVRRSPVPAAFGAEEPSSAVAVAGDLVQYDHPDWGTVVGEVLTVEADRVLVQDRSPNGAREWWPLAGVVPVTGS